jgi:peptidoglycan hydrolase-like protein with peptidoglycan-binding domain
VYFIQQALVSHGYTVDVDGYFGPGTEQAIRDFQRNAGLEVDGLVGPHTWSTLGVSMPGSELDGNGIIDPYEVIGD